MGEIIGFAGSSLAVLLSLCILIFALSELKIFRGETAVLNSSIFYSFGIMSICLILSFIYYNVGTKNINTELFKTILGKINSPMNTLTANFSINALKSSGFMPLYPILVKILGRLCYGQYEFTAIMLSTVSMGMSVYYFSLAYGKQGWLLPLFPLAFTGFMALPYSLSLLFTVMIFYYIKREKYAFTFILCILLLLTDIRGVFIIVPMLMIAQKKIWLIFGALIPFAFLFLFYGSLPEAEISNVLFMMLCIGVLAIFKDKQIKAELIYGILLIIAGVIFPFMRINLLLALPVTVALLKIDNTYLKYFTVFTSCILLAYMLISAL